MKVKTVRAALRAKFDEFVKTIKDENVRKLVEENTIITGGCIASMLLKEPVNDYDLYFRNFKTAKAVADYYVEVFKAEQAKKKEKQAENGKADPDDESWDGRSVEKIMKAKGLKAGAKGKFVEMNAAEKLEALKQSLTKEKADVDIPIEVTTFNHRIQIVVKSAGVIGDNQGKYHYFEGDPDGDEAADYLKTAFEGNEFQKRKPGTYAPILLTGNAITLSDDIQLVFRFYGDPAQIHQFYDFVHCTNYWTSWDNEVVTNKEALESLLAKELRYIGSQYPICSIMRIRKFLKRGWTINAGQVFKMCVQLGAMITPQDDTAPVVNPVPDDFGTSFEPDPDDYEDRDFGYRAGDGLPAPGQDKGRVEALKEAQEHAKEETVIPPSLRNESPEEKAVTEAQDAQPAPVLPVPAWTLPGARNLLLANKELLQDQLVGVDQAYFEELISKLKEPAEDGKTIDQTYLFKLIDEIF